MAGKSLHETDCCVASESMIQKSSFQETERDWIASVPPGFGVLFGQPLSIKVGRHIDEGDSMADESLDLVRQILATLPEVLRLAAAALERYEKNDQPVLACLTRPYIWLGTENDDEDKTLWTLVVERSDWPDFGYHIEFKGTDFVEIWAGD